MISYSQEKHIFSTRFIILNPTKMYREAFNKLKYVSFVDAFILSTKCMRNEVIQLSRFFQEWIATHAHLSVISSNYAWRYWDRHYVYCEQVNWNLQSLTRKRIFYLKYKRHQMCCSCGESALLKFVLLLQID